MHNPRSIHNLALELEARHAREQADHARRTQPHHGRPTAPAEVVAAVFAGDEIPDSPAFADYCRDAAAALQSEIANLGRLESPSIDELPPADSRLITEARAACRAHEDRGGVIPSELRQRLHQAAERERDRPWRPWAKITPASLPWWRQPYRYLVTYGAGSAPVTHSRHLSRHGAERHRDRFLERAHHLEAHGLTATRPEPTR